MSGWQHARAIALLPGFGAVVVPGLILSLGAPPLIGWELSTALGVVVALVGAALVSAGLAIFTWTVRLFRQVGEGTLAPWDPTRRLVVEGPYRHVRNPMISAVATVLAGEAIFFGSLGILVWLAAFLAVNSVYLPLVEEPGLERRFGEEYAAYRRAVPRWLPRLTPWRPRSDGHPLNPPP